MKIEIKNLVSKCNQEEVEIIFLLKILFVFKSYMIQLDLLLKILLYLGKH